MNGPPKRMSMVMVRPMAKPAILLNAPLASAAVAKTTKTRKKVRTASSSIPCMRVKSGARSGVPSPTGRQTDSGRINVSR